MSAGRQLNRFNDALFKYIFAKEEHKSLTLDFVNAVFAASDMPLLKDFTFRDREQSPVKKSGKAVSFDIVGECSDGTKVNIEVQASVHEDMIPRTLYYWSRLFTRELQRGEEYDKLTKTVCINFLDYCCAALEGLEAFHNKYELRNTQYLEHRLTDLFSIHFIEMPKWEQLRTKLAEQFDPKALSRLEKWLCYFSKKIDEHKREELVMGEPALQQVRQLEQKFIADPKLFEDYEQSEEDMRLLRASWRYVEKEANVKTARNLLAMGLSVDQVAKGTSLDLEIVQQLANEQ